MTHRKTPHFFVKNAPKTPPGVKVVKAKSAKSQGCARICAHARQPPLVCALIKPSCLRILKLSQNPAVKAEI